MTAHEKLSSELWEEVAIHAKRSSNALCAVFNLDAKYVAACKLQRRWRGRSEVLKLKVGQTIWLRSKLLKSPPLFCKVCYRTSPHCIRAKVLSATFHHFIYVNYVRDPHFELIIQ